MAHFDIPFQDKNNERKMLYRRIERICEDVRARIFDNVERVRGILFREGQYAPDEIDAGTWRPFGDEEYWGYREQYCWFRQTVTIPAWFRGRQVVYAVDPQPEKGWESSCFQFILFVNGEMAQGMDHNHPYAILTECAEGGETFDIALNAYCDDNDFRGQAKFHAFLKTRDTIARDLFYDLSVPLLAAHQYDADDLPRVHIIKALNSAVNMLDLTTRDVDRFHTTAKAACAFLHENLYGVESPVRVSAIGHTHIDTAWRWRLRQTRDKAARSFATVLALMKEYPDYKFMSPQAQLYAFVKEDYPALYARIRESVRAGRWEPEGSMWVESDTNVISGESLVRQFLFGKRFFREEFGTDSRIMWLPDVFGYSASLPQIMKLSGIDYFMTTKISWSETDRLPYDTFRWKGIDGTQVLAHCIPSMSEEDKADGFQTTYNTKLNPDYMINGWRRYADKDLNEDFLCSYGHGDGGGGPTRYMLENGRRMREGIEGCPQTQPEFARVFFDRLAQQVEGNPHLPTWRGELYLQFHRGTLTSQSRNKRNNRKSEFLMHDAETLQALSHLLTHSEYLTQMLREDWKLILLNQFHDIIPGSSIAPVYADSDVQYDRVFRDGDSLLQNALDALTGQIAADEDSVVVFNTLGFERTCLASVPHTKADAFELLDSDGSVLPWQRTHDNNYLFLAKDVPAKGYKAFRIRKGSIAKTESRVSTTQNSFDTPYLYAEFDEYCNISLLLHKPSGRRVAPEGEALNRLIAYEDRPNVYDAWEIKSFYDEKYETIDAVERCGIIEAGPLRTVFRVERPYRSSHITQDFIFYADFDRIDVEYTIDWHEEHILLKADYPVDVNATRATFDIQFGNLERTTHNNTTWDFAQFEVCGHRWADLSDNSFGLSILNDCKYGWNVKDGHIRPSILRCATNPNAEQDREIHHVRYSIYPHAGAVQDSGVVQAGYALNVHPYSAFVPAQTGSLPPALSFVQCDKNNVIVETIKMAEDDDALIVRTYETWNRSTDCTLRFGLTPKRVFETDLTEQNDRELSFENNQLNLYYKPFQIRTLKLCF